MSYFNTFVAGWTAAAALNAAIAGRLDVAGVLVILCAANVAFAVFYWKPA